MGKKYSLSTVKKAFWETFHESGEAWFGYFPEHKKENQENTQFEWKRFLENLKNIDTDKQLAR